MIASEYCNSDMIASEQYYLHYSGVFASELHYFGMIVSEYCYSSMIMPEWYY